MRNDRWEANELKRRQANAGSVPTKTKARAMKPGMKGSGAPDRAYRDWEREQGR